MEVANILKGYGYNARRGQQYSGLHGDADVIGLDGVHIEVKRREKLNLHDAMKQSARDARGDEIPTVWHRKNNEHWLVTVSLEDFMRLYERWKDEPAEQDT